MGAGVRDAFPPPMCVWEDIKKQCGGKSTPPKGGSLPACTVTQGRLRYTCQPCAIESITPMGLWYTVRLAWAIECTMGNGTPQCLMEIGRGGLHMDG